ncbi:GBS Bsp-like repeat-containing protein [Kineothrix sp. MSJ-39]|uniref:GBS Bsp-like repeat-containing protein n=1 Tax=Kineothrix sp. MSJ-39 TaxID=2841533 RepID=UPI001C11A1E1|nr:GBS Bsp-like repeat-containing protein [Kineothrix sp. MSJ-39]MBU5429199.1 GBS Bsp-like repeat-containing protein [Kineothrix sp. MSJ-39]
MKEKMKHILAMLLALCLFAETSLTAVPVLAEGTDGVTVTDVSETVSGADTSAQTEQQTLSGNQPAKVREADLLLNYLYVENMYIESPAAEKIYVSAGSGQEQFTKAVLTLQNKETGETKEVSLAEPGKDLVFTLDSSTCSAGVYQITALSYTYEEETAEGTVSYAGNMDITQIPGMEDICFGIDREVAVENMVALEDFADVQADTQSISAEEAAELPIVRISEGVDAQTTGQQLAQAIAQAKGLAVQTQVAGDLDSDQISAGSVVVVLDAGHDDKHAGARANGLAEESMTIKVANYCKEYLEANYTNVVVYMTRTSGACPHPGTSSINDNAARVDYAHSVGADMYVSIHFNSTAGGATTVNGAAVYYPNSNYNNDAGSKGSVVASKIIEQLAKLGLKNNGILIRNSEDNTTYPDGSLADYYGVIRRSKLYGIPAVIVEHAYVNNPSDAAFLSSEDNLKKLGVADALGIANAWNLSTEEVEYDADDLFVSDVDDVNGSFKITLKGATPISRIANVKFKVYPTSDSSESYLYTAKDEGNGTYTATANVANHNKETGTYKIIAYAYDAMGKKHQLRSTTTKIEEQKADPSAMKLTTKLNKKQTIATLSLTGAKGAAKVSYKVSVKADGKTTKKTYNAELQDDGSWLSSVKITDFKKAGTYEVAAYSKSYFGTTTKVATGSFTVDGPSAGAVTVRKVNLNKGTFQLRLKNIASASKVKTVKVKVRNLEGKRKTKTYTAKKNGNYYDLSVAMKDYGYALGKYRFTVQVTDGNCITKDFKAVNYTFEKKTPVITAKLKSKETKLMLTAEDLGIAASIKGVRFRVYNTEEGSKKKNYEAKKDARGVFKATVKIADFGMSGTYKVQAYIKGENGKYTKVGKVQKVKVSDITGGQAVSREKNETSGYLTISSISANTVVEKVEVKAWPVEKTKAKYTYKAASRGNGKYRALIQTKNHGNVKGDYRYQVIVTGKNGISKVLLKGKMTIGDESDNTDDDPYENGKYTITGSSTVTVAQMVGYYQSRTSYPSFYGGSDATTIKKFCQIYLDECEAENIRAEVAFAQAMKETNFLRFGGDVSITQYSFAGIGAVGGGAKGQSFSTVRQGIRAQVQHLKAYANYDALNRSCVDPRFSYVSRGTAPYVEWLGIPDNPYGKGWATAQNYGSSILRMINDIKSR